MGILDEHNRQHTFGNSAGPPTSVVGVSAQQAIDAQGRLASQPLSGGAVRALGARQSFIAAAVCALLCAAFAAAAWFVGGIGAAALGLVALVPALIGVVFLVLGLIALLKAGFR